MSLVESTHRIIKYKFLVIDRLTDTDSNISGNTIRENLDIGLMDFMISVRSTPLGIIIFILVNLPTILLWVGDDNDELPAAAVHLTCALSSW